ncbi:RNA-binding protein [Clostridium botulinum]|nr:RNA-binding protein [Clostridium botulinum]NFI19070.1 RNA-binding protein [Clostridium botulinum]NFI53028.1 RNA-binding protein [Clostridium botulinum]NFL91944.1 RNA-binding protein [Clostridium botulinum]NFN51326.1 RNA-binding protein [Clostridium botulinum]
MKEKIINYFSEEDKIEALNLYEKYVLAVDKDIPVFGNDFYSPKIWSWFKENCENSEFKVTCEGIFKDCERKMISFNNIYDIPFPIKLLKVQGKSKFSNLEHKDFLGGILSLGIERNKIGDLIVEDNVCYVPIHEDIFKFLLSNVDKIGRTPCSIAEIQNEGDFPKIKFKEDVILVSSLRIDGIVSKISKLSRSKAQMLIDQGQVLIDYNNIKDKSYEVKVDERIVIRGIGKFIVGEVIGSSKSGKYKLIIKKYT